MRILHVIDSGGLYGAEVVLLHLMQEQVRQGLAPILASIGTAAAGDKPVEIAARERGLEVETFRMRAGPNLAGVRRIRNFAASRGMDLIHSHGYKGDILLGLAPRWLRGFPMVSTVHGFSWSQSFSRMYLYERLDVLSLQRIERVILVNPAMLEHPLLEGKRHFDVVENGIPTQSEPAQLPPHVAEFAGAGNCVACVGRISHEKGTDLLVEAIARLHASGTDIRLALLGEGPLRPELQARAEELGIADRVLFAGYVDRAGSTVGHFDLFVMPSRTEGLPMVLLEAMAAGATIVATRVGGIPSVLDEGRAGMLVEAGSVDALRDSIAATLADPAAANERRRHAAARVKERYSSTAMATGYLRVYEELLETENTT